MLAGIFELWQSAWPAAVVMVVLATAFAVVLLIASIRLHVKVDPRVEQVHQVLPGLDCGACGYAGCEQYAKAVINNPQLIGRCAPGGAEVASRIAEILNLQVAGGQHPLRPVVHCRAHTEDKVHLAEYQGIPTCTAANATAGAQACKFGCLGFGDCVDACRFDALHIVDGLATVDYEKCTGCTACSTACPRDLIEMVPFSNENMMVVACSNKETGKAARKMCKVGCIACGLCAKQSDLFQIEDNLARVDYENYRPSEQTETAYDKCPTGVIVYRGVSAPAPRQPGKKKTAKRG